MTDLKVTQNFVKDPTLIDKLLAKTAIDSKDTVLEIGAGSGVITGVLSQTCKQVIAVEADPSLMQLLTAKFNGTSNVKLVSGDFLAQTLPDHPYKVFANIPFNITAATVRKLLMSDGPPTDSYLFLQEEAASKFAGAPAETLFSVLTKPWYEYSIIYRFRRSDFEPAPAVEVVLLEIKKRDKPLIDAASKQLYRDFTVYGFTSTKPKLKKTLEQLFTYKQFKRLAQINNFKLDVTPRDLLFEQWLAIFSYFTRAVEIAKQRLVDGAEANWQQQQSKVEKVHRTHLG